MKYCPHCGTELIDEAVVCVNCGIAVTPYPASSPAKGNTNSGLKTAAKVFMIIGTVVNSIYLFLILLAWCLPMTIYYNRRIKENRCIGTGFKICSLLFVNTVAGILMLCDQSTNQNVEENTQLPPEQNSDQNSDPPIYL